MHPRILVADDNAPLVERVAELLASSFDVVAVAHDGRDLVAKALSLQPDVIVVDISMPFLSGIEAIRKLRESGFAAKSVFLTIHGELEFVQACLFEGAKGFVLKSHMKDDLIPAVNAALAGKLFISSAVKV